jgi:protoheme IX farnesyltransferase
VIKAYYKLTKPGIIYGNLLATLAGFCLASHAYFNIGLFVTTVVGIACIIASGCVFNNYFDRDIDRLMERTKKRALVTGQIPLSHALLFGTVLAFTGTLFLLLGTNQLTTTIALGGLFFYVVVYSMWTKRHTLLATLIGAVSGAVPPVVGYCAVTNSFDTAALLLFLILGSWQIPHALAITIYREDDYTAASVPLLAKSFGMHRTKVFMLVYVIVYVIAILALSTLGFSSRVSGVVLGTLGVLWIGYTILGFWTPDTKKWGKKMFFYSLVSLLAFCISTALDMVWLLVF